MPQLKRRGRDGLATISVCLGIFVGIANIVSAQEAVNQPPGVFMTSPTDGATYPAGSTIPFSVTAWDDDGAIAAVDFFVDDVLYATQYYEPYGIWLPDAAPGTYTLTAVAWDDAGAAASDSRILTVEGPTEGGNEAPSVSVTSPVNGASYPVGATIPFSATATSPAGISQIELYVDGVWYATAYSSSHSIALPDAAAGVYTLTATARDNNGVSATSPVTTLIVGTPSSPPQPAAPSANEPPVVSLTAPASGARFTAPASITMGASASDADGTIVQVEFYANAVLMEVDTSSPYSFSWTNVSAGDYALTAVARDDRGAATASSTRDITISPPGLPGTAVFTPSGNHATAVDRYVLDVFPLGADPTVANPVVTQDLGKPAIINGEITADVSSTILALSPGDYIATVTAIGNGGSAQSAPSPQFTR